MRNGPHKTEAQKRRLLGRRSPGFWERYSYWNNKEDWLEFVDKTNQEFSRVLKSKGIIFYKITESPIIDYDDFLKKMSNFKLINDECLDSKSNLGSGTVHFLTLERSGGKSHL